MFTFNLRSFFGYRNKNKSLIISVLIKEKIIFIRFILGYIKVKNLKKYDNYNYYKSGLAISAKLIDVKFSLII